MIGPQLPHALPALDDSLAALLHNVQPDFLWQAHRMPDVSRRLLLERAQEDVPAETLLAELQLTAETVRLDAPVLRKPQLLSPAACAALRCCRRRTW